MMNKKHSKIATYIGMSMLYTILGYAVIFLAGAPVMNLITSQAKMILTQGAPSYPNEFDPDMYQLVMKQESTFESSEIQVPTLGTHYGNISCERIALEAPIYYGDSDIELRNGVGQYIASSLPGEGKPILIGGHDTTYFAPLEQIEIGDVLNIMTNYGQFKYEVAETKVADSTDTTAYDLTLSKEQLILYTCYPFGQIIGDRNSRYFVYCDRISDSDIAKGQ